MKRVLHIRPRARRDHFVSRLRRRFYVPGIVCQRNADESKRDRRQSRNLNFHDVFPSTQPGENYYPLDHRVQA